MKYEADVPRYWEWLKDNKPEEGPANVGVDPRLVSQGVLNTRKEYFE